MVDLSSIQTLVDNTFAEHDTDKSGVLEKAEAKKLINSIVESQGISKPPEADIDAALNSID